jgi:hypothetical protein
LWADAIVEEANGVTSSATAAACSAVLADLAAANNALGTAHVTQPSAQGDSIALITVVPVASILCAVFLCIAAVWVVFYRFDVPLIGIFLRWLDLYSTKHNYGPLECVRLRPTVLGGGCTLLAAGTMLAVAAGIITQRFANNSLVQVGSK